MKKILFVCSLYRPHVGGIETMVEELSKFCLEKEIEPMVLTKKWPLDLPEEETINGVKVYRLISAKTDNELISAAKWVIQNKEKLKTDIVHIIGVRRPLPLVAQFISQLWKTPLISTIAGGEIPIGNDDLSKQVWQESREISEPVIIKSDVVTCVSKALLENLKEILPEVKNVINLYAGIDTSIIDKINNKEVGEYIISVRRLFKSKGVDELITAFKLAAENLPGVTLKVAGDGPEMDNLKSLTERLGLGGRVEFLGTISLSKTISLLRGAICTVVPSRSEGGGLINVEAQYVGCPVIASNVGGIPEYVKNNVSGLLYESGNIKDLAVKIKNIYCDEMLRKRLSGSGKDFAKTFSWDTLGPKYLEMYNNAIATHNSKVFIPSTRLEKMLWDQLIK